MVSRILVRVIAGGFLVIGLGAAACAEPAPKQSARVLDLIAGGTNWTAQEVSEIAAEFKARQYLVAPSSSGAVVVQHAAALMALGENYGEMAGAMERLKPGIYWNFSAESAFVSIGKQASVEVPAGTMLVVGDVMSDAPKLRAAPEGQAAGVACGSGYYACCRVNADGISATAVCVSNDIAADCSAGGLGATSASLAMN